VRAPAISSNERLPDDAQIRQYLLGRLGEQDATDLERRYFDDSELMERLGIIEQELIDDYVQGRLPLEEVYSFEGRYLTSPIRREKVEYARAVHRALSRSAAGEREPQHRPRRSRFRIGFVYATLALFCVAAAIIVRVRFAASSATPVKIPAVRKMDEPKVQQERTLVTFRLSPRLARSNGIQRTLRIPEGVSVVQLQLDLEETLTGSCELVLFTAEGRERLRMVVPANPSDAFVRAELPASKLPTDDYVLELQQSSSVLATYSFRVIHP
jgi:hypothetical protein